MNYWDLVEPIWNVVSIYDGPKVFLEQYEASPVSSRTLLTAHWCQSEVRNGGFSQFFGNSTGVLAPEAREAYLALGMPKTAKVVGEAMSCFNSPYPRDREKREAEMDRKWNTIGPVLEQLDNKFFELIKSENGGFKAAADRYAKTVSGREDR